MARSGCTHLEEAWELGEVGRDIVREGIRAFDWVNKPSTFDGGDSESCCGGGSTVFEDEKYQ